MSSLLRAPVSFLWDFGSSLHRKLYEKSVLPKQKLPKPVVSVGNWTMGGTGKTPFTDWLIELAKQQNKKVAILSRGYGRISQLTEEVLTTSKVEDVGDEPLLLKMHHPECPIFVGRSRYLAGLKALEKYNPDFFILDDGFQHHQLERKTNIVLIDATQSPQKHKVFPLGWARESEDCLQYADWIVHTKTNFINTEDLTTRRKWLEGLLETSGNLLSAEYQLMGYFNSTNQQIASDRQLKVLALAGIAHYEPFFHSVEKDFDLLERFAYSDHQVYTKEIVDKILEKLQKLNAKFVVVTEKDWVKLKNFPLITPFLLVAKRKVVLKDSEGYRAFCQQIFA